MPDLDPASIDLPTLAALAGAATGEHVLAALRKAGHPGVRPSHGYVIQRLIDARPTVGELAVDLGVTQQAASKSIAELEGLGLIVREVDAADSRIRRVVLTREGVEVLETARQARRDLERAVATAHGDVDAAKAALVALLDAAGGTAAVRARRARPPQE